MEQVPVFFWLIVLYVIFYTHVPNISKWYKIIFSDVHKFYKYKYIHFTILVM